MKTTTSSRLLLALVLVFTFMLSNASAWDSIGAYTHRQLTRDAISSLPASEYPDIAKFAGTLVEYSANESKAHNYRYWASGGDAERLWLEAYKNFYLNGKFIVVYRSHAPAWERSLGCSSVLSRCR